MTMASAEENFAEGFMEVVENDFTGVEIDYAGVGNDLTGAENDVAGTEIDNTGSENNIDGDKNYMDGDETHIGEDEDQAVGFETDGAENKIAGVEDIVAGDTEKKENLQDGHNDGLGVRSSEKKWPGWPGESVFRMLVPSHKVGGIIGRKGEFIKKMCEESRARIKILDAPPGAPERAVIVSAREEQDASISPAMDGLLKIHTRSIDGLDAEVEASQNSGSKATTRLLANATQAGTLIGKNGTTIKSIQEASKCIVRVLDDVPPFALQEDKVIEIQGQPIGVHKALELIASHLRKYLVDRSVIPLFESQMSRPTVAEMHQNMPPPPPQHWGHPQGLPPPGAVGPGFGGNHPQFMHPPRPHDNFYPPPEMPPYEKTPHHGISAFGRDVAPMGAPPTNQHGQQVTQHMQIPISYADAVIGSGGANISYIRRASGATITIQESRGIPGEMTVEINGTATQLQTAQQLIQNFMADATPAPAQNQAPVGGDAYASSYGPPPSYYSAPQGNAPPTAAAPPSGGYGSSYGAYGY